MVPVVFVWGVTETKLIRFLSSSTLKSTLLILPFPSKIILQCPLIIRYQNNMSFSKFILCWQMLSIVNFTNHMELLSFIINPLDIYIYRVAHFKIILKFLLTWTMSNQGQMVKKCSLNSLIKDNISFSNYLWYSLSDQVLTKDVSTTIRWNEQ